MNVEWRRVTPLHRRGQGNDKAVKAVNNALHHPLLESINLENATGIIANFTGGKELSFIEVAEALNLLQEKTNNHAEVIPGVINDERMGDRAQTILIITGIAATPVDQNFTIRKAPVSATVSAEGLPFAVADQAAVEMIGAAPVDLDIPAFLRRRTH